MNPKGGDYVNFNVDKVMKELDTEILKTASKSRYKIECPTCHKNIFVKSGHNVCPNCGDDINVHLKL